MKTKYFHEIVFGLALVINNGCINQGRVENISNVENDLNFNEPKIRTESRKDGIIRLSKYSLNGNKERIEVFVPHEGIWINLRQTSLFNQAKFNREELDELMRRYSDIEFYHTHLYINNLSNESVFRRILPSKNDLVNINIQGKQELKLGIISYYGVTMYGFEGDANEIFRSRRTEIEKQNNAVDKYFERVEIIAKDKNINLNGFLTKGFRIKTDRIDIEFKPITEIEK